MSPAAVCGGAFLKVRYMETKETEKKSANSEVRTRIITGAVYVLAVIALCAAKWLIPEGYGSLLFDALFCAVAAIGAFELIRAFGCVSNLQRAVTITFSALSAPMYVLFAYLVGGAGWQGTMIALGVGALAVCVMFVADHARSNIKSTLVCLFALVYVGLLSAVLSAINHMESNSMLAIMFAFICVPFTDAGAYIIGMTLGRFVPLKLAPKVSPHKTVIGAVGGIIGGIIGAVAAYYLFVVLGGRPELALSMPEVVAMIITGIAASVATQFGDLFESAVKRECSVKDMGRLLPGHGGILDRFDGTLFAGIVILLAFAFMA